MAKQYPSAAPVTQKQKKEAASSLQQKFNRRIKKIRKLKARIEAVESATPKLYQSYQQEIQPIQDNIVATKVQVIKRLDQAWEMDFFRPQEKAKLRAIICEHAFPLLQQHRPPELEILYDKHASAAYQQEAQKMKKAEQKVTSNMFKEFFDKDINVEGEDMEENQISDTFFTLLDEKWQQKEAQKSQEEIEAEQAKEAEEEVANVHISQISRVIYTRLVKEFHPDKEPDEEKRLWKTEVMKQVIQAYKQDHFSDLLSLEVELMKGRAYDPQALPDQQLKSYNKKLKHQIKVLKMQLDAVSDPGPPFRTVKTYLKNFDKSSEMMKEDKKRLQFMLTSAQKDLEYLSDEHNIRDFLRTYSLEGQEDEEDLSRFDFFE